MEKLTQAAAVRAALLGVALVVLELVAAADSDEVTGPRIVVAFALGAAVSLVRAAPLAGVAVLVLVEVIGAVGSVPVSADEIATAVVVYQCARRGSRLTLWVSGALVPTAYFLSGAFLATGATSAAQRIDESGLTSDPAALLLLLLTVASPLAVPWLLGLTLRWRARTERDRHDLVRAHADAELREQQARLARDVHDVVGHSLVVILRQADSVRYLSQETPSAVLVAVDAISASARGSLSEIRHVLSSGASKLAASDLDELIARIPPPLAAAVRNRVLGQPRPLPPDAATVAHRVLQEMLTNAMKHGVKGEIDVLRDWREGLRLVVSNPAADPVQTDGMGLTGMRQRLDIIGGALEVRRDRDRFSIEAVLPLRSERRP